MGNKYEDLVKQLKEWPRVCQQYEDSVDKLHDQAADAIEGLKQMADAIPHVCECCIGCEVESGVGCDCAFVLSPKRAREYLSKPRWIPVTERLPEAAPGDVSARVLVTDGKDVAIVEWFNFEECGPFWGYTGFGKDITHWQPLPQPPKTE